MQLFKTQTKFDFMAYRKRAMVVSAALLVIALGALVARGLAFGIDFTGGTLIELGYQEAAELETIRTALADAEFGDAVV